ncbi:MAG: hypothetical protein R3F05_09685 [Planctomycetota bacterium]
MLRTAVGRDDAVMPSRRHLISSKPISASQRSFVEVGEPCCRDGPGIEQAGDEDVLLLGLVELVADAPHDPTGRKLGPLTASLAIGSDANEIISGAEVLEDLEPRVGAHAQQELGPAIEDVLQQAEGVESPVHDHQGAGIDLVQHMARERVLAIAVAAEAGCAGQSVLMSKRITVRNWGWLACP